MRRTLLSLCALILMGSAFAGCMANPSGRSPVVPFASTPVPVGERGDAEPVDTKYVTWNGSGMLESNTAIVTSTPLTFDFKPDNSPYGATYKAVVAPLPGSTEPANCRVVPPAPPAMFVPTNDGDPVADTPPATDDITYGMFQDMGSTPEFRIFVGSGFVYLAGARPHGETGSGEVTSDGTWIIIKTGATSDRFFLLHADPGKSMTVKALLGAKQTQQVSQSLRYVDVNLLGQIGGVTPIPLNPDDPIYGFVNQVVQQGVAAGIASPPNWPPLF